MAKQRKLAEKDMKIEKRIMRAIEFQGVHIRDLYYSLGVDSDSLSRIIENLHAIGVIERHQNIITLVKDSVSEHIQ